MSDFTNVGNEIGGFLGGMFNPILGGTTTTTTTKPTDESKKSNSIVIIVAVALIVVVVGYFALKPKNKTT